MAKADTQSRILDAARIVFTRNGWIGATTQEIARTAEVNEVTLFRHFGSKSQLFAALVAHYVQAQQEVLSQTVAHGESFEEVLTQYAQVYLSMAEHSADFVRTMLGEMSRHPEEVRKVIMETWRPLRVQFIEFLLERQRRGDIRQNVNCETAMDLFVGMLFSKVVKPQFETLSYQTEEYIRLMVQIFILGLRP